MAEPVGGRVLPGQSGQLDAMLDSKPITFCTMSNLFFSEFTNNCKQREIRLLKNIQKNIAIVTFKSLHDLTPVYLKESFQYSTHTHGYNTKSAKGKKLVVSQRSNTWQIRTFKARAIRVWNALPASITRLKSQLLLEAALLYDFLTLYYLTHEF